MARSDLLLDTGEFVLDLSFSVSPPRLPSVRK